MNTREDIANPLTYILTTLILVVLTALNIGAAQVDLRGLNGFVALAIAAVEVLIMALVFMRLRSSRGVTWLAAIAGLFWLGILLSGTLDDVLTRGWLPVPGK